MRIVTFNKDRRVGVLQDGHVVDVNAAYQKYAREKLNMLRPEAAAASACPADLDSFIKEGERALDSTRAAVAHVESDACDDLGLESKPVRIPIEDVRFRPPLTSESRVFMAMGNYAKHVWQFLRNQGETVSVDDVAEDILAKGGAHFIKHQQNVVTTGEPVRYPRRCELFDYEAEVGVVIGRSGRDISAGQFEPYVWGVVLLNDWSIRADEIDTSNFGHTKNFDTALSIGPWIAVDEDINPDQVPIECSVNGSIRQHGNTSDMVLSFAELGEYLSTDMTILPGDIIGGGTPDGCALDTSPRDSMGRLDPTLFLAPGDEVVASSPELGRLTNTIVASDHAS